jgi:hypothetical protein
VKAVKKKVTLSASEQYAIDLEAKSLSKVNAVLALPDNRKGMKLRALADATGIAIGYLTALCQKQTIVLRRRRDDSSLWWNNWADTDPEYRPTWWAEWAKANGERVNHMGRVIGHTRDKFGKKPSTPAANVIKRSREAAHSGRKPSGAVRDSNSGRATGRGSDRTGAANNRSPLRRVRRD